MKSVARPFLVGISTALMFAALSAAFAQKPVPTKAVGYAKTEKIMKAKCIGCHQGAAPAAGVDLSSYAGVKKAKFKGKAVVVPKKSKLSVLARALHGDGVDKMPPGGSLPAADIKVIEAWINAGASK